MVNGQRHGGGRPAASGKRGRPGSFADIKANISKIVEQLLFILSICGDPAAAGGGSLGRRPAGAGTGRAQRLFFLCAGRRQGVVLGRTTPERFVALAAEGLSVTISVGPTRAARGESVKAYSQTGLVIPAARRPELESMGAGLAGCPRTRVRVPGSMSDLSRAAP
jgi:hypothetical protein